MKSDSPIMTHEFPTQREVETFVDLPPTHLKWTTSMRKGNVRWESDVTFANLW